ncbi:MAG: hypothetical protein JNK55_21335 [Rubrivivax sp.]|nr:hypothetical protein [Rubrivivax sp.]
MKIEGVLAARVRVRPEVKVDKRQVQPQVLHKFGIGELLYLCFDPPLTGLEAGGEWRVAIGQASCEGHGAAFPGEARVFCPDRHQFVKIEYRKNVLNRFNEVLATVEFEVIEPVYAIVRYEDIHYPSADPNAGFRAAFMLTPDTVSFARVALRECGGANTWKALADLQPAAQSLNSHMTKDDHRTHEPILGRRHTDGNAEGWAWYFAPHALPAQVGSYVGYTPQVAKNAEGFGGDTSLLLIRTINGVGGTAMFSDRVYNPIMTDAAWTWLAPAHAKAKEVAAHYGLDIPLHRKVVGRTNVKPLESEVGTLFATNRHSFKVLKDGTLTVSKGPLDSANCPSVTFAR